MTTQISLTTRIDVELALNSMSLNPPPKAEGLQPGATADLRDSMARFSAAELHSRRRSEVVLAVEKLAADRVRHVAAERTVLRLQGGRIDAVADVGFRVPTEAMCCLLDTDADLAEVVADTLAVVKVIGRGEPSSVSSDSATKRLLERFGSHPAGAVPAVSLLYQNHDATAALLFTTIVARHRGTQRRCAITSTTRIASHDTTIGATTIAMGTVATLDLDTTGFEFGAGPHQCPGQHIAEAIVDGIIDALNAGGYRLRPDLAEFDDAGRAIALPMERAS